MNRRTANFNESRGCSHKRKRNNWRPGWPDNNYWTGEANGADNAFNVNLNDGNDNGNNVGNDNRVACRR